MAEGDGVEIIFEPDMSRVAKAIDDIEKSARGRPITVPIAGTGSGAGEVSQFSRGLAELIHQERTSRGSDVPDGFWGGRGGGGGGAGRAAPGGANGGLAADEENSRSSWYLQRYATIFAGRRLINFAGGVLQAGRNYNIAGALAGGNQQAEYDAFIQYRQHLISAGGGVGEIVGYLQDPSGSEQAGASAMIAQARAQDAIRTGMQGGADLRRRIEQDSAIVQAQLGGNPVNVAIASLQAETGDRLSSIQRARTDAADRNDAALTAYRATLSADHATKVNALAFPKLGPRWGAIAAAAATSQSMQPYEDAVTQAENALIESKRTELGTTLKPYDDASEGVRELSRQKEKLIRIEHERGLVGINTEIFTRNRVSAALASGDTEAARIAGMQGQGMLKIREMQIKGEDPLLIERYQQSVANSIGAQRTIDAREFANLNADVQDQTGISRAILARQPLVAKIRAIQATENRAIRQYGPKAFAGTELRRNLDEEAQSNIDVAVQQDADTKRIRRMELSGEGRALDLELQYRPEAANAVRAASRAHVEAQQLRDEGDPDNAGLLLQNAIKSQEVRKKRILESVDAAEIDINRTALGTPRRGEDTGELLKGIQAEIAGLRSDLANGSAAAQTTD